MTAPVLDPMVAPLALALLECYRTEVAKVAAPPARVELRPGDQPAALIAVTEDECCRGLAIVQAGSFFPTDDFPNPDTVAKLCGHPVQWAVTLEMAAFRCAPVGTGQVLPTGDAWQSVALAVLDDAAAQRRALCCFAALDMYEDRLWVVNPSTPLPVLGACVGTALSVVIAAPACDCGDAG